MKQVVRLRVGIDSGAGGIQGPLFDDGTFEFVCIPDGKGVGVQTYGTLVGETAGRTWITSPHPDDSGWQRRLSTLTRSSTFTYGNPTTPKRSLRKLRPGDYLVFVLWSARWDSDAAGTAPAARLSTLAGVFEVALAGTACDSPTRR